MPVPVTAVLFDYGLVRSGPPYPPAWQKMRTIMSLDEPAFHAAYWTHRRDYDRGIHSGPAYWRTTGKNTGLTLNDSQIEALIAADNELWTQSNQPMIDFAQRLQAAGTCTGILSNLGDSMMHGVLAVMPWLSGFDFLLWSHTLGLAKPDLDIYLRAAEGLATPPAQILFIDDREENIAGGQAAGMQTIRYTDHAQFEQDMEARGWGELYRAGRT
jgi:putative hydrolase of the HAD superfamily